MTDQQPTMPLREFQERERQDSNLFWRLDPGDHQNLLDEAIEQRDAILGRAIALSKLFPRTEPQQRAFDHWLATGETLAGLSVLDYEWIKGAGL